MLMRLSLFKLLGTVLCGIVIFAHGVYEGDSTRIGVGLILINVAEIGVEFSNANKKENV